MSYTVTLSHIVFGTYCRRRTLVPEVRKALIKYIYGIARKFGCNILACNVMPEHVHILVNLHPDVSLSKFVGNIKQSTNLWMKGNAPASGFEKWAKEYYGVSVSPSHQNQVKGYVDHQEQHHGEKSYDEELNYLVNSLGMMLYKDSFVK